MKSNAGVMAIGIDGEDPGRKRLPNSAAPPRCSRPTPPEPERQ
ncbi:hypothetical protein I547_1627 [Mycobacterium kansasii 824]|nr:hypothetical protein I547_1627 [Mycobacterium kansasii 824]